MRISDWSSDVCSSDLRPAGRPHHHEFAEGERGGAGRSRRSRYRHRHAHSSLGCCNLARGLSTRADRLEGWGRLREGAESYAKLAQIAGARSYLLLPSTVAPERRRLSSIRRWLRILQVSGPTRLSSMKPDSNQVV